MRKGSTVAHHRGLTIGIIACAVVAVVGIALWMVQLSGGMIQTGMRNSLDSWGFYITLFMFFVGLSAGGLIISSIPNAFGSMKGFGDISRVAIWTSISLLHLRGHRLLWWLTWAVPCACGSCSFIPTFHRRSCGISSCFPPTVISILYLWAYRREDEGKMSPPSASSPSLLWWWRWAAHGDGLDFLAVGGPRVLAHRPYGPVVRGLLRWIAVRRFSVLSQSSSPCRRPGGFPSSAPP